MSCNRIQISRRTARWSDDPVTVAGAMDFWSFAAGAANVIMQLSRPGVGYGVVESKVDSGNLLKHPWKRARTTFQYLAVAIFGTDADRAAFRAAVDGAHRHVKVGPGQPGALQRLRPRSADVGGGLPVRRAGGHLPAAARRDDPANRLSSSTARRRRWAPRCRSAADQWPPSRVEFDGYWDTACEQVQMDDVVRGPT